jgi:ABC-type Fe3+ transport system permease subunit
MSLSHSLGLEAALLLLVVASLAAVQARAVRGAQGQVIQELCRRRRRPERYEEIVAASETIAFIAASIVVIAAVAATLLAFRGRRTRGRRWRSRSRRSPAGSLWPGACSWCCRCCS